MIEPKIQAIKKLLEVLKELKGEGEEKTSLSNVMDKVEEKKDEEVCPECGESMEDCDCQEEMPSKKEGPIELLGKPKKSLSVTILGLGKK